MKILYLFIVIISLAIISGCSKDNNPVTPSTKGSISGKIADQTSGNPISGASINTQPATTTVTSDNAGNYTLSDVEEGSYSLTVSKDGYFPNTANVNVTANQTKSTNISLSLIPPDPVALFSFTGGNETPATINFQNNSQNANSYLWEFGDNTTSTETNPSKVFNQKGSYIVKLTASNTVNGKSNETSKIITITPGKVFLQRVIVDQIPFTDNNGAGWDLASGPDLYFTIIDSARNVVYATSSYYNNLTPSGLPVQWDFSPELQFLKSSWNKTYFIDLWDYDVANNDDEIGFTDGFKIIQQINANFPTTVSLQNSNGTIKVRLILRWQ